MGLRKCEIHAHLGQMLGQAAGDNFAKAHLRGANLHAGHLEATRNNLGALAHIGVLYIRKQALILGDRRDQRHQVAFSRPVVTHDKEPHRIRHPIKSQFWEEHFLQSLGHVLRNDIASHQLSGFFFFIAVAKLDNGFDRTEINKICVAHRRVYITKLNRSSHQIWQVEIPHGKGVLRERRKVYRHRRGPARMQQSCIAWNSHG